MITNDDGYDSFLLQSLFFYCKNRIQEHKSFIVAPHSNKSGISHAVNISETLTYEKKTEESYAVMGTPADCVNFAFDILGGADIVLSGPNIGANLGQDILYSGTVAAARESILHNTPAIAFSIVDADSYPIEDFDHALFYAFLDKWLMPLIMLARSKKGNIINVNIANLHSLELYESTLSKRDYLGYYSNSEHQLEKNIYQVKQHFAVDDSNNIKGSDAQLVLEGKNVYTVFGIWPSLETCTNSELYSYIGVNSWK